MSEKRRPAFNIRLSLRDGSEQRFESYSGKEVSSKWRNIGAAWPGRYEETPYNLTLEPGTKLVLPDGTVHEVSAIYLDLRKPYENDAPKRNDDKPATKGSGVSEPKRNDDKPATNGNGDSKPKRRAAPADPFV